MSPSSLTLWERVGCMFDSLISRGPLATIDGLTNISRFISLGGLIAAPQGSSPARSLDRTYGVRTNPRNSELVTCVAEDKIIVLVEG